MSDRESPIRKERKTWKQWLHDFVESYPTKLPPAKGVRPKIFDIEKPDDKIYY